MKQTEELSSFSRLALELDGHFSELSRIGGQIERLDIDSESGLDHAVKLLNQFAEHGNSISQGIQEFAKVLQEARESSEAAARSVSEHAQTIHERKLKQNQMREELNRVSEKVKAANAGLSGLRKDGKSEFNDEEKRQIRAGLKQVNHNLKSFLTDVQAIKESAVQSKFKSIEHEAKKLLDVLRSSSRKIDEVIGEP